MNDLGFSHNASYETSQINFKNIIDITKIPKAIRIRKIYVLR